MSTWEDITLKLIKDVPLFYKGSVFFFEFDSSAVYRVENGMVNVTPLRGGLAGYLWLLRYESGYFRKVKDK